MSVRLVILVDLFVVCLAFMSASLYLSHTLSLCLGDALASTNEQFKAAHTLSAATDRQHQACLADRETYSRMVSCVRAVQKRSSLYGWFMTVIIRQQGILSKFVQSHNDLCPGSRIEPVI